MLSFFFTVIGVACLPTGNNADIITFKSILTKRSPPIHPEHMKGFLKNTHIPEGTSFRNELLQLPKNALHTIEESPLLGPKNAQLDGDFSIGRPFVKSPSEQSWSHFEDHDQMSASNQGTTLLGDEHSLSSEETRVPKSLVFPHSAAITHTFGELATAAGGVGLFAGIGYGLAELKPQNPKSVRTNKQ